VQAGHDISQPLFRDYEWGEIQPLETAGEQLLQYQQPLPPAAPWCNPGRRRGDGARLVGVQVEQDQLDRILDD